MRIIVFSARVSQHTQDHLLNLVVLRPGGRQVIVGLGEISDTWEDPSPYTRGSSCVVKFRDIFYDQPVLWSTIRSKRAFGSLDSTTSKMFGFDGGHVPTLLTENQWTAIVTECTDKARETPPAMKWEIELDQVMDRADLHDLYGGSRSGPVSVSGSKPHIFIFSGGKDNRVFDTRDGVGSLVVEVPDHHARAVAHHVREGRALRLFHRTDRTGRKVRYRGLYIVGSDEPILDVIDAGERHGRMIGERRLTWTAKYFATRIKPIGGVVETSLTDATNIGRSYRIASEDVLVAEGDPSVQDASRHTRSTRAHRKLQNELADLLREHGIQVLSPDTLDADFDLAAQIGSKFVIIEVKSIDKENYTEQIRKGFSQVCHYAEHYILRGFDVVPILYVEHQPPSIFESMAARRGVHVAWPGSVSHVLQLCR